MGKALDMMGMVWSMREGGERRSCKERYGIEDMFILIFAADRSMIVIPHRAFPRQMSILFRF